MTCAGVCLGVPEAHCANHTSSVPVCPGFSRAQSHSWCGPLRTTFAGAVRQAHSSLALCSWPRRG